MPLIDHAHNVYSQNGEDGILARIFQVLGIEKGRCCEFGAWDGVHFSNTRALLLDGWSGVLIEANPERSSELEHNYADRDDVHTLRALIGNDESRLDAVLNHAGLTLDFELVSIDIDGLDYEALYSMGVRPLLVCVEVNAGHSPSTSEGVPSEVAKHNVGQPLGRFVLLATCLAIGLLDTTEMHSSCDTMQVTNKNFPLSIL